MNESLAPSARQLLALVRASLWQKPVEEAAFLSEPVDWNMIGRLAMEQTVGGLVFEAALSLPENLLPPTEWVHRAMAFIESNRRTHLHVNKCAAEAEKRLSDEGIPATLLKGQAYASVYPKAEMRQCGDIDLYVGEDNYHSAYLAVKSFGWKCKNDFTPEEKHYVCELRGVKVELHKVAAKLLQQSLDRKFRRWSSDQILASDRKISIVNQEVPIPTPLFDVVFVFLHLYRHFLNGGIGLRHICDWAILLHAHRDEIDHRELRRVLTSLRLLKGWKSFVPVLVIYLGLPEDECPFYSKLNEKLAGRAFSAIMEDGNFGRAKTCAAIRPEGYLSGKIHSVIVMSHKYLNKYRFDPERVLRLFCNFIIDGTVQVVKDIKKGALR